MGLGLSPRERQSLTRLLKEQLPQETAIPAVHEAVELGIVFHYAKTHGLQIMSKRLSGASAHLDRMNAIFTSIQVTAYLIQTAVWALAFFGCAFLPIGLQHFESLRTKVTRILLHQPKSHACLQHPNHQSVGSGRTCS